MMPLESLTVHLKESGQKALVPFLTAGYPDKETFDRLLGAVAASGCRILEIGVPFSDPTADGPVIQAASQRALQEGVTLSDALAMAGRAHRDHGLLPVLMGYLNPILNHGFAAFAADCARNGVAGCIVPDLPPEEADVLRIPLADQGVALVDLVAPTSPPHRLAMIGSRARGFLYLVAVTGVTGSDSGQGQDLTAYIHRVGGACDLPRYVGFGVNTPEQAVTICRDADGVIIGSQLIRIISEAVDPESAVHLVQQFLTEVNRALSTRKETA
jgi:tryptophan synthase alpha chain